MNLNYVRFDVGHYLHICHRQTLEKYPDSALARYVAPQFDTRKTGDDYILIDRDGKHFGSILNFMRDDGSLILEDWSDSALTDLLREADFYCLSELVHLCEKEFVKRENANNSNGHYIVPPNFKLEVIFGLTVMRELLSSVQKPTIVISHRTTKRFNIDSWFAELIELCDHDRFNVYCFADKNSEARICDKGPSLNSKNFIVALYEPSERGEFVVWVAAPPDDRFRARRAHYKCKIFKFWFVIQNDLTQAMEKQRALCRQKTGAPANGTK